VARRNVDPVVAHERAKKAAYARTTVDHHIDKLVDAAPPLTPEQRDRLATILGGASRDLDGAA
jgi:hypothetical protein